MAKQRSRPINVEKIRSRHRPDNVSILFVGESPPASEMFFYSENSRMFKHMQRILVPLSSLAWRQVSIRLTFLEMASRGGSRRTSRIFVRP